MVQKKERYTFAFDKMTTSLTASLIVMDDLTLDFSFYFYIGLTVVLLAGGLILILLIFWCFWSRCSIKLGLQAISQRKIEKVISEISRFYGISFLVYAFWAFCAFTIFSVMNSNKQQVSILELPMLMSLNSYSSNPGAAEGWNKIQLVYKCCGVHNYSDWFGMWHYESWQEGYQLGPVNTVPDSCCKQLSVGCGRNISNPKIIHENGCLNSFGSHIEYQIQRTITAWQCECLMFFGLFVVWFGSMCVYTCVYMCRKYKGCIPSNIVTDDEAVTNVDDNDHNCNGGADACHGADNDENSDPLLSIAEGEENENIADNRNDASSFSDEEP